MHAIGLHASGRQVSNQAKNLSKMQRMRAESMKFFKQIVNTPSPSGFEMQAAQVYRDYCQTFADKIHTDLHGNVWAILNPNAECKVMLAGHMDEIGFLVHYINDEGFLAFKRIGGHDASVPVGQRVWVHGKKRLPGVIGFKPIHLQEDDERNKKPKLHDLWVDIGAGSKEQAEKLVPIGSPVTYQVEFQQLLGDIVTARGFDNKMGSFIVAEALRLLKEEKGLDKKVGVYAVATVQEEVGLRGAQTAAYGIGALTGLAVDVNHATDQPGVNKQRLGEMKMGKGPTVARGANINPITFQILQQTAQEEKIAIQIEAEGGATGTDAWTMQVARGPMATGLVGVPIRYMHTPCELLNLKDVEACARLMAGYCRRVKPSTDFTPRIL